MVPAVRNKNPFSWRRQETLKKKKRLYCWARVGHLIDEQRKEKTSESRLVDEA
jgi:hypothetical protein